MFESLKSIVLHHLRAPVGDVGAQVSQLFQDGEAHARHLSHIACLPAVSTYFEFDVLSNTGSNRHN